MANDQRDAARLEFLIAMYNQLMEETSRHIVVIWQSMGVLGGAFAAIALVEKEIIPFDIASAFIIMLCAWVSAMIVDSAYWYNRNLVIIANIERIFLKESDARDIHYYFISHRKSGSMLTHLKIQLILAVSVAMFVLIAQFRTELYEMIWGKTAFRWMSLLPAGLAAAGFFYVWDLYNTMNVKYREFVNKSPGAEINNAGVNPRGPGHPVE